jgi:hypothetical protein
MKATVDFENKTIEFDGPVKVEELNEMFRLLSDLAPAKQTTWIYPSYPYYPNYPTWTWTATDTFTDQPGVLTTANYGE